MGLPARLTSDLARKASFMHDLDHSETLVAAIESRQARVGIIGLGYVGLPLMLAFANKGFPVVGFDIDQRKIEMLASGKSYIREISDDRIRYVRESGRFAATADFGQLSEVEAILVCVPTPLTPQREPDMSFVENTTKLIASHLRRGQLVVLESTTYPGTSRTLVRPLLETSGLRSERDFLLAYSPEREDPGNIEFNT